MRNIAKFRVILLSWFGSGLTKRAPGTVGSAAALPVAALIAWTWSPAALVLASGLAFLLGWATARAHLKGENTDKDPQWIVIDEVAGQWLALAVVPLHLVWYLAAFAVFRIFDIYKPWPVGWADRKISGALGIMLDDILAAMYAALLLYGLQLAWTYHS